MNLESCEKHKAQPVQGYSPCTGCEIEYERARIKELERQLADVNRFLANESLTKRVAELEAQNERLKQHLAMAEQEVSLSAADRQGQAARIAELEADAARLDAVERLELGIEPKGISGIDLRWRTRRADRLWGYSRATLREAIDNAVEESEGK